MTRVQRTGMEMVVKCKHHSWLALESQDSRVRKMSVIYATRRLRAQQVKACEWCILAAIKQNFSAEIILMVKKCVEARPDRLDWSTSTLDVLPDER